MKTQRRALIVDDEEAARNFLRKLLAAHPEISVVAEAGSVVEAVEQFHKTNPDLVFLDVQMPKGDGFSLLPKLQPVPEIIFITAHDAFAVKAFEVNAVDYLLKPIPPDRLAMALERLARKAPRKPKPFTRDDRIFLYADLELRVVPAAQITCIQAAQNYSHVHIGGQEPVMVRRAMAEWERLLPSSAFLRVNRSTILNLNAVREILPLPHHHTSVSFTNSSATIELRRLPSRRLRKALAATAQA
ncbi:MAG: hypothetical protein BGO12_08500 [Verrucomicrobia bacterium 61-8]|mgnify:CR=1 FL=1|jgi:two-component system LytT family response regulator|nr:response regulator transcription factor [Verrucomicrobiota bacterium]OJV11852.1 MAG: hypothetical protein BGO12_08500 [Verrucomicrobia bacterium 61-8]